MLTYLKEHNFILKSEEKVMFANVVGKFHHSKYLGLKDTNTDSLRVHPPELISDPHHFILLLVQENNFLDDEVTQPLHWKMSQLEHRPFFTMFLFPFLAMTMKRETKNFDTVLEG